MSMPHRHGHHRELRPKPTQPATGVCYIPHGTVPFAWAPPENILSRFYTPNPPLRRVQVDMPADEQGPTRCPFTRWRHHWSGPEGAQYCTWCAAPRATVEADEVA